MYSRLSLLCLALSSSVFATDYAFLTEDSFVQQNYLWHFDSDYTYIRKASFSHPKRPGSSLQYSEGNASVYFSHFLDRENALTWEIGANYVGLDWAKNPHFSGDSYVYGLTSFNWISFGIDKWRWVLNGGVAVDTKTFNFGKTAVYYTTLWGRYQKDQELGFHIGFFAYYGALNGYVLPILGLDWKVTNHWEIKGVFPIDASVNYHFTDHLTASILATSMGGPYRFPRRMHGGDDQYAEGIFKVYSNALEAHLEFKQRENFSLGAGGGYDFGGWIQIADSHNHHKKYYDFNGAPYGRVFASLTY